MWVSVGLALLAAGFALAGLPLLEAPGLELATAAAVLAALLGAPAGIAAARRELRVPVPSAIASFARAAIALVAGQALLLGGAVARTALLSPCSPTAGLAFLPLVSAPSALLAAALGTFAGLATGGRRARAAALYAAIALGSVAFALWDAYRGPGAYVLVHLLGLWPGPVYDEALAIDGRLLFFRAGTLAWTGALVSASAFLLARGARRPARGPAAALLFATSAALLLHAAAERRGDIASRATLDRVLGGRRQGDRCDLHYPREKPAADAERLWRDCELDVAEIAAALGVANPPRVAVWLHRSEEEKRRLVGAGQTEFTKPWLAEVQLLDAPGGPAALRHELVHAVAGSVAGGPLRVPAAAGLAVNAGLVEGLAVALDLPRGEWTVHEWARAMRDMGVLPPARRLVEPAGFFAAAPARAYAASGSLLRFLLERYGPAPVRLAYAGASFERAFGRPLAELEAEWLRFLDGVQVPPELASAAETRFRPPGLLGRRCAREVAGLERLAARQERDGRPVAAAGTWRRAAALSGDPGDLLPAALAVKTADPALAERSLAEALRAAHGRPALRGAVLDARGDLRWLADDGTAASELYRAALAERPDRPRERLLQAKLATLSDPALAGAAPWLLGTGDPAVALARLAAADRPLAAYLLGRAALARGAPALAAESLARALAGPLPSPAFRSEALRLLGESRCASGDEPGAAAAFVELASSAAREADRELALAGARRCGELFRAFGPPPRSTSDWPQPASSRADPPRAHAPVPRETLPW